MVVVRLDGGDAVLGALGPGAAGLQVVAQGAARNAGGSNLLGDADREAWLKVKAALEVAA